MTEQSERSRIRVDHARVGSIDIAAEEALSFDGLPGFPEAQRFALLRHREGSCFAWLACLDDPGLAFSVVDPLDLFAGYQPELGPEDLALVGAKAPGEVCLLAIANLSGPRASANLAAPLLVHATTRRGAQLTLADERWPLRAELPHLRRLKPARSGTALRALRTLNQTESNPQT